MTTQTKQRLVLAGATCLACVLGVWVGRAQEQKKPQLPCDAAPKVFVLDAELVEAKVKELNQQGYCVRKQNFVVVGNKLMIVVDDTDLYTEEEYEEEEEDVSKNSGRGTTR